jgi:hypothetical protein
LPVNAKQRVRSLKWLWCAKLRLKSGSGTACCWSLSRSARASDHATLDVMKLGGVSGWLQAMALALAAGMLASSHTFPAASHQRAAAHVTAE